MTYTTIRLYGWLGARFGRVHRLVVASPAEAIKALSVMVPGFRQALMESQDLGISYAVFVGKRNLGYDELRTFANGEDIRIAPILQGAKAGGVFQTILGGVLLVASIWFPAAAPLGISMTLGGVTQLISRQPNGVAAADSPDNGASYYFNGIVNTEAQGNCVGLAYGRVIAGSAVGSGGIYAEDQQ
ncbi:phage tail protein [Pandoraea pneumonica]|uniref:Phage tail protein n=1 Tax=Pandoraea pneumonica TaxID=2508299 RepID=A0A5E4WU51_9BURK|nr:tail assembly protein [Pandoraea pneumonica]VVE28061.1 phage tail protein [Pandoraea pneumonica]